MTTDARAALPASSRLLRSRLLPAGLLAVAAASALLALVSGDDATDTVLGAVCGAAAVLLLFVVLVRVLAALSSRRERAARDGEELDRLEPLQAARRDARRQDG